MKNVKKKTIGVDVYFEKYTSRQYVGRLTHKKNRFVFYYDDAYLYSDRAIALGPDLPCIQKEHKSKDLFISFEDRIPSKQNPAYKEYCQMTGISPQEKDPLVLLSTIGQKGPSSFIFVPVYDNKFTKEDLKIFRKSLNLSIRDFAKLFDFAPATIHRIEQGKSSGKDALKRVELYSLFPQVALYEVNRFGHRIGSKISQRIKKILEFKLSEEHKKRK